MADENGYDQWIAERRQVQPPAELIDRVMVQVEAEALESKRLLWLRLWVQVRRSRLARGSACLAAGAVGSCPFVYLAYVAQLFAS